MVGEMNGIRPWRVRGLVATVVAGALIALALGGPTPLLSSSSAYPGEGAAEAPNRVAAEMDARNLLARLVLPPGSSSSATQPQGSSPHLSQPFQVPGTRKLIDQPAWWSVPGSPQAVLEAIKQQPPEGSHLLGESSDVQLGVGEVSHSIQFSWPSVTGVLSSRSLLLTGGRRIGRKDGFAGRRPGRLGRSAARLRADPGGGAGSQSRLQQGRGKPPREFTVLNRRAVRRIAALIDGLPIVQPIGPHSCPAMQANPRTVTLTFRAAPAGAVLAKATQVEPPGACPAMSLEIHGTGRPALTGAETVLRALGELRPDV
jgi:hypothetical protein